MSEDAALQAWLDGTADAAACTALAERLDREPELRRRLLDHARDEALLAAALRPPPALAPRVLAGLRGAQSRLRLRRAVMRDVRGRRRLVRRWIPLLAAAAVVALLGLIALLSRAEPPAPVIADASSSRPGRVLAAHESELLRDGAWRPLVPGALSAGDRIRVAAGGSAELALDGARLALAAGAELRFDAHGGLLTAGVLRVEAAPRVADHALAIATPQATATVLGTAFSLAVADGRTRLEVTRGRVRLGNAHGMVEVGAGGAAEAEAGATPSAWRMLFADFAAWQQQHGRWSQVGGTVRGDGGGGKARLISPTPYRDFELDCRLRIRGAEFAEIQVGDYNWFVEVPAADTWVAVRLRQYGGELTATADGHPLRPQPGDGADPRPGPLSFYIRAGSLELADARLRE